jgi:hypothetical protein
MKECAREKLAPPSRIGASGYCRAGVQDACLLKTHHQPMGGKGMTDDQVSKSTASVANEKRGTDENNPAAVDAAPSIDPASELPPLSPTSRQGSSERPDAEPRPAIEEVMRKLRHIDRDDTEGSGEDERKKSRISGRDATRLALDQQKYPPVNIEPSTDGAGSSTKQSGAEARLPERAHNSAIARVRRTPPPRIRKPSALHEKYEAPAGQDHETYRARLRETFGTMSKDFVDFALGKLVEALKPNPHLQLDEKTFNGALAMLHSANCQTELQALAAVEIVATGFAGLRFLRQSQQITSTPTGPLPLSCCGCRSISWLLWSACSVPPPHRSRSAMSISSPALRWQFGISPPLTPPDKKARARTPQGPKMTIDPIRQADVQRRLRNMTQAPRCGAKTRAGMPCRQAAVGGRNRCRMHGGAKGSGGPAGGRNGSFRSGLWTRESIAERQKVRAMIRDVKARLRAVGRSEED